MTTVVEPEWDQATRDIVLGLDAVPKCPVCGRDPEVCQDAARADDWRPGDPVRCYATTALREKQKGYTEETNPHLDALLWPIALADEKN